MSKKKETKTSERNDLNEVKTDVKKLRQNLEYEKDKKELEDLKTKFAIKLTLIVVGFGLVSVALMYLVSYLSLWILGNQIETIALSVDSIVNTLRETYQVSGALGFGVGGISIAILSKAVQSLMNSEDKIRIDELEEKWLRY